MTVAVPGVSFLPHPHACVRCSGALILGWMNLGHYDARLMEPCALGHRLTEICRSQL
jgi:hypothetical protein